MNSLLRTLSVSVFFKAVLRYAGEKKRTNAKLSDDEVRSDWGLNSRCISHACNAHVVYYLGATAIDARHECSENDGPRLAAVSSPDRWSVSWHFNSSSRLLRSRRSLPMGRVLGNCGCLGLVHQSHWGRDDCTPLANHSHVSRESDSAVRNTPFPTFGHARWKNSLGQNDHLAVVQVRFDCIAQTRFYRILQSAGKRQSAHRRRCRWIPLRSVGISYQSKSG